MRCLEGDVKSIVELIGFDVGTLLLGTIMTSVALTPHVYVRGIINTCNWVHGDILFRTEQVW